MEKEKMDIEVTKENELSLIDGLLKASEYKNNIIRNIEIRRDGKLMFSFKIRPLSMDEVNQCRKNATVYVPNPNNYKLPKIAKETNEADFLAYEIYVATVDEDKQKIWDNSALMDALSAKGHDVHIGIDVIKAVLTYGEILRISDVIDSISGDGEELIEYAKN